MPLGPLPGKCRQILGRPWDAERDRSAVRKPWQACTVAKVASGHPCELRRVGHLFAVEPKGG